MGFSSFFAFVNRSLIVHYPKGKPHRKFTQAEKLAYISAFQDAHISQSKFAKEHGLNLSMFERWMKEYGEQ